MRGLWGLSLALWLAVYGFASGVQAGPEHILAIATGGTGGVFYPIGGGMADVLTRYVPGVTPIARVTGGSVDNLKLIGSQQTDVALAMADTAVDAFYGQEKFKSGKIAVRTLMVLYPNVMHVVTFEGSGIERLSDLKGRRVSTGSPASATEVIALRLIDAAGLDKNKDIARERMGIAESVEAFKAGKIDAFFWVGLLPTPELTELANPPSRKFKLVDQGDVLAKVNAKYRGIYGEGAIPAGTYPRQDKASRSTVVQTILVANASMPAQQAYDIVKTIMGHRDELLAAHAEAKSIGLASQTPANAAIPWHPGAARYFTEKGVRM